MVGRSRPYPWTDNSDETVRAGWAVWTRGDATTLSLGLGAAATLEERAIRQQMMAALTAVLTTGVAVAEGWKAE